MKNPRYTGKQAAFMIFAVTGPVLIFAALAVAGWDFTNVSTAWKISGLIILYIYVSIVHKIEASWHPPEKRKYSLKQKITFLLVGLLPLVLTLVIKASMDQRTQDVLIPAVWLSCFALIYFLEKRTNK